MTTPNYIHYSKTIEFVSYSFYRFKEMPNKKITDRDHLCWNISHLVARSLYFLLCQHHHVIIAPLPFIPISVPTSLMTLGAITTMSHLRHLITGNEYKHIDAIIPENTTL
ncbi:hypothetical protein N9N03_01635 [Chlamydiia bacterium]|nr:hypothetical protein [Chlamydiia bacterium]